MPHLEVSRPRPDSAVITLNRPEKLNAWTSRMQVHLRKRSCGPVTNAT